MQPKFEPEVFRTLLSHIFSYNATHTQTLQDKYFQPNSVLSYCGQMTGAEPPTAQPKLQVNEESRGGEWRIATTVSHMMLT